MTSEKITSTEVEDSNKLVGCLLIVGFLGLAFSLGVITGIFIMWVI